MDEPTSGLDARAGAIVMRTVRNTVDTGRTVVCTIHQPSIDIFEAFDELDFGGSQNDFIRQSNMQDLLNAMGSMFIAVLFLGILNASSVQPVVAVERPVFYRERGAGMCSAFPYAFGQAVIELPYVFVQAVVYGSSFLCISLSTLDSLELNAR
ncbi:ATP-binding cassette [Lithospermum erythrorhizon]|uniref:ATP-binding cassette n=1 Tax=Lithospermum erythrorhizon TaxID=34254 RepID=A0AAV3R027_LITER